MCGIFISVFIHLIKYYWAYNIHQTHIVIMKNNKENYIDTVHISRILGGEIENEPIEQFQLMKGLLNKINYVIR